MNNIIIDNLKSLSIDCNGICVVKKFVNTNKTPELKEKVIGIITGHCLEIVQSPFGNYAVQHLIEVIYFFNFRNGECAVARKF